MLTPNGNLLEPELCTTIIVVMGSSHLKNQPDNVVCLSNEAKEHVEYEGRILEGTLDTLVDSIFIRWLELKTVRTIIDTRRTAMILNIRVLLTISLLPRPAILFSKSTPEKPLLIQKLLLSEHPLLLKDYPADNDTRDTTCQK